MVLSVATGVLLCKVSGISCPILGVPATTSGALRILFHFFPTLSLVISGVLTSKIKTTNNGTEFSSHVIKASLLPQHRERHQRQSEPFHTVYQDTKYSAVKL